MVLISVSRQSQNSAPSEPWPGQRMLRAVGNRRTLCASDGDELLDHWSPSCQDRDVAEREHLTDDQRKHLDFIQAVIARLSTSSSTAKGWGLTVAMAA